jgi:phage tail sheath gpL-like
MKNVQFIPAANNVPRKILIIGTYDPLKTLVIDEVPVQILSPEDAGDKFGFGFMAHRLAEAAFLGSEGVETWVQPQSEAGGAVAATGDADFAGASGVLAGTLYMYIAGIQVPVILADADTADNIATKVVAAITANVNLPVTAVVNGVTTSQVDITAKSKGPWGNDITIRFNIQPGDIFPTGVTSVSVTDMASGAGIPTMADALDGLGTGDDANEANFTDMVHGYGTDSTTLGAISTYVGAGNDFTGLYSKTVARPFRALTGDITAGAAGLSALIAIGDARKTDRSQGIIAVPDSANHSGEIAAQTIGHMARVNNDVVAQSYKGIILIGVDPGDKGTDRWTSAYDSRDSAVKAGISPTKVENGAVILQNVITFYHPDSVPVTSNGYREMVNIAKVQNILYSQRLLFSGEKYQGFSIVNDVAAVTNITDRVKAIDIETVKDDLVQLYYAWASRAWIADAAFSIDALSEAGSVTVRTGGDGFDIINKIILSGVGNIIDQVTQFDTSFSVLQ